MEPHLLERLNLLWQPVYPFLGKWMRRWCPDGAERVMELGPFSGGVTTALLDQGIGSRAICVVEEKTWIGPVKAISQAPIEFVIGRLDDLCFSSGLDLIVFRGAFFFLTDGIIKECYRILRSGGRALMGGGYGPFTPSQLIDGIGEESKILNYRLGKRLMSKDDLLDMVSKAGLQPCCTIMDEGGLWLLLRK
jgi:hypothetical protein